MFIVIEIQSTDTTSSVLTYPYEDGAIAENKYHTVLAAAATSSVPVHTALMINEMGTCIKSEHYRHLIPEPEEDNNE